MTSFELDEHSLPGRYQASGWFNGVTMFPLLAAAIALALAMGFVLVFTEEHLYYVFVTPLVVGAPVFASIWGIIRLAHCRSPLVGTLIGLVLGLIYYVGYWDFSYRANIVAHGPGAVAAVQQIGGAPGLPGYVVYRCKTSVMEMHPGAAQGGGAAPNMGHQIANCFFFSAETIIIVLFAAAIGRSNAQRVYYEEARQWSSKLEFRLSLATLAIVLKAIKEEDWGTIAALPRLPKTSDARNPSLRFRLEYLAGSAAEPAYLTLAAINVWTKTIACPDGTVVAKPRGGVFYKQITLEPRIAQALAKHFPGIAIPTH